MFVDKKYFHIGSNNVNCRTVLHFLVSLNDQLYHHVYCEESLQFKKFISARDLENSSFFCDAFSIEFPVQKYAGQMLHCFILRFFLLNRANLTFSLLTLLKRRLVSE